MNVIQFFIAITLFIEFIESSKNDIGAIKKLFQKDYTPVTVLLSTKTQQVNASQLKSKERENQVKELKIESVYLKDLYEKIKIELPDASLPTNKWSKLKLNQNVLSNTLDILQDFPKLNLDLEIQYQIYLDIGQFVFKCILYARQEALNDQEFKGILNGIRKKYEMVEKSFHIILCNIVFFYQLNSNISNNSAMLLSENLAPEILEGGDELFNKFDSILKDFHENGLTCKNIENKWFNGQFMSKPILTFMMFKYDHQLKNCFITGHHEIPISKRQRINDIKSIKTKVVQDFRSNHHLLTRKIFEFYKNNKFCFKIESPGDLYELLYAMDKAKVLTKENLKKYLEFPKDGIWRCNQDEFDKYLKKGEKSHFGKLLYGKVKRLF